MVYLTELFWPNWGFEQDKKCYSLLDRPLKHDWKLTYLLDICILLYLHSGNYFKKKSCSNNIPLKFTKITMFKFCQMALYNKLYYFAFLNWNLKRANPCVQLHSKQYTLNIVGHTIWKNGIMPSVHNFCQSAPLWAPPLLNGWDLNVAGTSMLGYSMSGTLMSGTSML